MVREVPARRQGGLDGSTGVGSFIFLTIIEREAAPDPEGSNAGWRHWVWG